MPQRFTCILLLLAPFASAQVAPAPEIFAPGLISGPANDGAPTFSPDGNTLFFTRSTAHWTVILESHKLNGQWSQPTLAPFSGEWPDSSPAFAPNGDAIIFQSTRPLIPITDANRPKPGQAIPGIVSNLWRVDRTSTGWSDPVHLAATVNLPGQSIWKPSIAGDGSIYLTAIDTKGNKRLYVSTIVKGVYQPAQPLPFSDGTLQDVDPEIAPDGSFLIFASAGRTPNDSHDRLFITHHTATGWGAVTAIRYTGDDKPYGSSSDSEPRLGPDHRTLYFTSDRVVPVHFPRTHDQARTDLDRLNAWDNSNSNIWYISLDPYLPAL